MLQTILKKLNFFEDCPYIEKYITEKVITNGCTETGLIK